MDDRETMLDAMFKPRKPQPRKKLSERFWPKVKKGPGCWEWTARKSADGYGQIKSGKTQQAHRMVWIMTEGPIPDGLFVLHRCDNRGCVNPDHLFLGTQKENVADMLEKGRGVKGESVGGAKLTEDDVKSIRESSESTGKLARRFGIYPSTIYRVRSRRTWKHV